MEINESFKKRVDEIDVLLKKEYKGLAEERFLELFMLFNKADRASLNESVIDSVDKLKHKIEKKTIKGKVREVGKKERKQIKIDDFSEICSLMEYQQFDEAAKKFHERKE